MKDLVIANTRAWYATEPASSAESLSESLSRLRDSLLESESQLVFDQDASYFWVCLTRHREREDFL